MISSTAVSVPLGLRNFNLQHVTFGPLCAIIDAQARRRRKGGHLDSYHAIFPEAQLQRSITRPRTRISVRSPDARHRTSEGIQCHQSLALRRVSHRWPATLISILATMSCEPCEPSEPPSQGSVSSPFSCAVDISIVLTGYCSWI